MYSLWVPLIRRISLKKCDPVIAARVTPRAIPAVSAPITVSGRNAERERCGRLRVDLHGVKLALCFQVRDPLPLPRTHREGGGASSIAENPSHFIPPHPCIHPSITYGIKFGVLPERSSARLVPTRTPGLTTPTHITHSIIHCFFSPGSDSPPPMRRVPAGGALRLQRPRGGRGGRGRMRRCR